MTKTPQIPPPPGSTENQLVAYAKEDLAKRLGIPVEEIELVSMEEVTWRDGSLGCPKPGMQYTQALVNGSLIMLSVDEHQYRYHSGRGGTPFLCENKPDPPLPQENPEEAIVTDPPAEAASYASAWNSR